MTDGALWLFILMFLGFIGMAVFYATSMQKAMKTYTEDMARQSRIAQEHMGRIALAKTTYDLHTPEDMQKDKISTLVDDVNTKGDVVSYDSLSDEDFKRIISIQANSTDIVEEENNG